MDSNLGTMDTNDSQTRLWGADATSHDIVCGDIMQRIRNSWDGILGHYFHVITISMVSMVYPEEPVPCDNKSGIHTLMSVLRFSDHKHIRCQVGGSEIESCISLYSEMAFVYRQI